MDADIEIDSDVEEFKEEELGDHLGSMISPTMPASPSIGGSFMGQFQIGSFGSSFNCPSFSASLNSLFNPTQGNSFANTTVDNTAERVDNFTSVSTAQRHVPNSYTAPPFPTSNDMNNNELSAVPAVQGMWQQVVYVPVMPMPLPMPMPMPTSAMAIDTFNTNPIRSIAPAAPSADASCRCPKSRCLKLYCDCFRSQSVCRSTCACVACLNTDSVERTNAINEALNRNPEAFQEKKTVPKGLCACKKSRCLKLYCVCFSNNTNCGSACKCLDCGNSG